MKATFWVTSLAFLLGTSSAMGAEPLPLIDETVGTFGWFAFGHGLGKSGTEPEKKGVWLSVTWDQSTWGNGVFYQKQTPLDVTPYRKIAFEVSSDEPTKSTVQVQFLTSDQAVLGTSPAKKIRIKDGKETHVEVSISSMVPIHAEDGQRSFRPSDLKAVDKVQIIFIRPEDKKEMWNVFRLRNIKLLP